MPVNISLGWKCLTVTLAYYCTELITTVKMFYATAPRESIIILGYGHSYGQYFFSWQQRYQIDRWLMLRLIPQLGDYFEVLLRQRSELAYLICKVGGLPKHPRKIVTKKYNCRDFLEGQEQRLKANRLPMNLPVQKLNLLLQNVAQNLLILFVNLVVCQSIQEK